MIMAKIINIKGYDNSKKEFMPALHYSAQKVKECFGTELKVVFLRRNVGDILSSYYAEKSTSNRSGMPYTGTISNFIRDSDYGVDAAISFNKEWLEYASKNDNIKVVSYEELSRDTYSITQDIINFLGFKCSAEEIREAVRYSEFENMSKIEKGHGTNLLNDYKGNFGKSVGRVRRGKVDGYKEDFSEKDIKFIEERKEALGHDC